MMRSRRTILLVLLAACWISTDLYAQSPGDSSRTRKRHNFLRYTYQAGTVLPTNSFLEGDNASGDEIDYYHSGRLEFGKQTTGERLWEQLYKYPYYGVGFYTADFWGTEELGYPNALYGFFAAPFKRWRKSAFLYELGFGLTYNWEPYDEDVNPYNLAIGSYRTVYIDAGLKYQYELGQHFDVAGGVSFTHFSNGSLQLPNKGINLFSPSFGIKYNFRPERPVYQTREVPEFVKRNEIDFTFALASKQLEFDTAEYPDLSSKYVDINYLIVNFQTVWHRQFGYMGKFGGGIDIAFDESTDAQIEVGSNGEVTPVPSSFQDKLKVGLLLSYEWVIDEMSIVLQPGYYIVRKEYEGQTPDAYQRLGVKYHFYENMYGGINIRAYNYSIADFIEWTVGYRFIQKKDR